jgi:hypothetical protein
VRLTGGRGGYGSLQRCEVSNLRPDLRSITGLVSEFSGFFSLWSSVHCTDSTSCHRFIEFSGNKTGRIVERERSAMVDLANFESLFDIGFAIHFAYPVLQEARERADADRLQLARDLDAITNTHISTWASFDSYIAGASRELRRLTLKTSVASLLTSVFNIAVLIFVGFRHEEVQRIHSGVVVFLLIIGLLPLPCFVTLIYFAAQRQKKRILKMYGFIKGVADKYHAGGKQGPRNRQTGDERAE